MFTAKIITAAVLISFATVFLMNFLQDKSKFSGFSEDFASQNKFQINIKYNIN